MTERSKAWAFRYNSEEDPAPRLLASGQGHLARKILELAREAGVPVLRDPDLAVTLEAMRVGDWIPVELFEAFAGLLAGLYRINRNWAGGRK